MKQCICIWKKQECFSDIQSHNHHLLQYMQVQLFTVSGWYEGVIIRSSLWMADALLKWSYACHSAVKPCSSNALTVISDLIWSLYWKASHCMDRSILPQHAGALMHLKFTCLHLLSLLLCFEKVKCFFSPTDMHSVRYASVLFPRMKLILKVQ